MPFYEVNRIKYYKFPALDTKDLYHAVFTRRGGYSPSPWKSLNFGASVGDDVSRVEKNRTIALNSINKSPESVYDLYQIHSINIVSTIRPRSHGEVHLKGDAILTNKPGVTLMMRFADCVPILLFDPIKKVIGIVHAGWMGTVGQITKNAVSQMMMKYKSNPREIIAAIGPSIGPDHYIVGSDVTDKINDSFGKNANQCIRIDGGKTYLDLWKANEILLREAGVSDIEVSGICTCCNLDDWYSHRGEHGKTGRFGIVFGLSE